MNNKEYQKQWRINNREKRLAYEKKWREENKDKVKQYYTTYLELHPENKKTSDRKNYQKNKKSYIDRAKKYNLENKEKVVEYNKHWISTHKEQYRHLQRKAEKKLYSTNIQYRIKKRERSRLRKVLSDLGIRKTETMNTLFGCTLSELKNHLESTFKDNMTWKDFPNLHIDHIIPCCAFDLTKKEERLKCFHYTNLRFLTPQENLKKIKEDLLYSINSTRGNQTNNTPHYPQNLLMD